VNDSNTSAMIYPDTPGINFTDLSNGTISDSYNSIKLSKTYNEYFVISSQGKSI
jgi:hypothetical protein